MTDETEKTIVSFLLDETGSMESVSDKTLDLTIISLPSRQMTLQLSCG